MSASLDTSAEATPGLAPAIAKMLLLVGVLAGGVLLMRQTGTGLLRTIHPDLAGALALVLAGAAMTAAGMPRQILAFAGGSLFGLWTGIVLSMLGQMGGCVLDLLAARTLAGGLAARILARPTGRLTRRLLDLHPFIATLTLRLLPVGSNTVLNLLAGAARVRLLPFLGGTILGYLPQTIIFVLVGSGTQVGRSTQLAVGAAMAVAAAGLGALFYRRVRRRPAEAML